MPSLVKKWQSIQKELDEEEKSSSSDEDRDQLNKKNIEEWRQQQLVTYVSAHILITFCKLFTWNCATDFIISFASFCACPAGYCNCCSVFYSTAEKHQRMPTLRHFL